MKALLRNLLKSGKGYGTVELMVVMTLFAVLVLATGVVFDVSQDLLNWNYHQLELQSQLRRILETMLREVRETSPSSGVALASVMLTPGSNNFPFAIPDDVSGNQVTSWNRITYYICNNQDLTVGRAVNNQSLDCMDSSKVIGTSVQSINFTYNPGGVAPRSIRIQITGTRATLKRTITTSVTGEVTSRNP